VRFKEAQAQVRPLGMVLRSDMETGEYRVNFKGRRETTAYYTPDLEDAVNTARAMAKWRDDKAAAADQTNQAQQGRS
jgi:hypothetical protein